MRIFLTGGTGFVGSRLLPALREAGADVVGLAVTCTDASILASHGASVCRGDLSQRDLLEAGMQGCDSVVHAAALMDVWGQPERFERINVHGTGNVIEAARAAGVTRLVHVSAAAVVLGAGDVDGDEFLPRQLPAHCAYARTKSQAEKMVLTANRENFTTLAIRPPMIWGRGDPATLPRLKEAMDAGRFAWINGGRNPYSSCHVDNVAEAVVCALTQGRGGSAYFVTDGVVRTYREVIESQLIAQYGVPAPNTSVPRWLAHGAATLFEGFWRITNRRAAPPLTRSLITLMTYKFIVHDEGARRELGYQGTTSVQAGLEELRQPPGGHTT
jgi:nucleoside-diphosphate-sugar epimerase